MSDLANDPAYVLVGQTRWVYDQKANAFVYKGQPAPFRGYGGSTDVNCKSNGLPPEKMLHKPEDTFESAMSDPTRRNKIQGSKFPLRYLVVEAGGLGGGARPVRNVVIDKW